MDTKFLLRNGKSAYIFHTQKKSNFCWSIRFVTTRSGLSSETLLVELQGSGTYGCPDNKVDFIIWVSIKTL